jgi:phage baseplate assembly protein W
MKQLQLRDGDLVLGTGGYSTIEGAARVSQDLGCAVREPLGSDRFHPKWGTVLTDYVGRDVDVETAALVRSEVSRVVQNYITIQTLQMTRDADAGLRSRFTPGDIITSIPVIQTQQKMDQINVRASVGTASGQTVSVVRTVEA